MSRIRGDLVDIAKQQILNKIESYELRSGSVISDLEFSKELNMSRTPIREAIMSLIDQGILERTPTKIVVKVIKLEDIIEIFEVRDAIERKSAEIIIAKKLMTSEKAKLLKESLSRMAQNIVNGEIEKNFDEDDLFHKTLVELSENNRLIDTYNRLSLQSQRFRWIAMFTQLRYPEILKEHNVILDSLINGDIDRVTVAVKNHLNNTLENYKEILSSNQWSNISYEIKNINS